MLFRRCAKATLQAAVVAGLVLTAAGGLVRPAVAETATAADHIASLSQNAITVLGDSQLTEAQKADELHALFVDGFDIKTLSRTVLGRHWRRADDSQRAAYMQAFERYVVKTYVRRLSQLDELAVEIKGSRAIDDRDSMVSTVFAGPDGRSLKIDWRVRERDGSFRIIDVVVENVSMAVTQRAEFASLIRSNGGRLDVLIAALEKKAAA